MEERPKVWASLGTTIQTRPYENVKIDVGVTGVPYDATDDEIRALMISANATLHEVVEQLAAELEARLRADFPDRYKP